MNAENIKAKVDHLRKTVGNNSSKEDEEYFEEIEKKVAQMERYADFLAHPVTKEVVNHIIAWLKSANEALLSGKMTDERGRDISARRDMLEDVLHIFSPSKLDAGGLGLHLDALVREYENYYNKN